MMTLKHTKIGNQKSFTFQHCLENKISSYLYRMVSSDTVDLSFDISTLTMFTNNIKFICETKSQC